MPRLAKYDWVKIKNDWLKSPITQSKAEFCKKYGLNYKTAHCKIKTKDKLEYHKKFESKTKEIAKDILDKAAEKAGFDLATAILENQELDLNFSKDITKELQRRYHGLIEVNKLDIEKLFLVIQGLQKLASTKRNIGAYGSEVKAIENPSDTIINPFIELKTRILDTFSIKQFQAYSSFQDAFALVTTGAVRSSKSYAVNFMALQYLDQIDHDMNIVISGNTSATAAANVVAQWRSWLQGAEFRNVNETRDQYMRIEWGNLARHKFYIVGGGKENDQDKVQGKTVGLWVADELSKHAKSFTDMMMSRLSLPYSKMMATMNPLGLYHYTTQEFIYNQPKIDEGLYNVLHFILDDNPSLSDDVKNRLKNQYPKNSVFYKRNILGIPAIAEGAVYEMFGDENKVKASGLPTSEKVVAVDYGTTNPCVWATGQIENDNIYIAHEYYYDSREKGVQKTDSDYARDMLDYFKAWKLPKATSIIIDPSAASFKAELKKQGFKVRDANNEVLEGIKRCQTLFQSNQLFIADDCPNGYRELESYVWDEKASAKGEDKPMKEYDHFCDMMRYMVAYLESKINIRDIQAVDVAENYTIEDL